MDAGSDHLVRCGQLVLLTRAERRQLRAVRGGVYVILNRVFCELRDGHDGSHMGRGQQNEDTTEYWWLT
jgi:hypothetical protein